MPSWIWGCRTASLVLIHCWKAKQILSRLPDHRSRLTYSCTNRHSSNLKAGRCITDHIVVSRFTRVAFQLTDASSRATDLLKYPLRHDPSVMRSPFPHVLETGSWLLEHCKRSEGSSFHDTTCAKTRSPPAKHRCAGAAMPSPQCMTAPGRAPSASFFSSPSHRAAVLYYQIFPSQKLAEKLAPC
jgi:hypothetical protein